MGVITYTREAKCKDCKWLKPEYLGKRKTHRCLNPMSKYLTIQCFEGVNNDEYI